MQLWKKIRPVVIGLPIGIGITLAASYAGDRSDALNGGGALLLLFTLLLVPTLNLVGWYRLHKGKARLVQRTTGWLMAICFSSVLAFIAVTAAISQGIELWNPPRFNAVALLLSAALLIVGLWTMPRRIRQRGLRSHSPQDIERLVNQIPTSRRHLPLWFLLSLCAGVFEEIVYRAATFRILREALPFSNVTEATWVALTVTILAFTLAHATQGWRAMCLIAVIAAIFHAVVCLTGSLYVAMVVHFLYDAGAGVVYLRLFQSGQLKPATSEACA